MPDEEEFPQEAVTRSFWSGTITFGLVNIPVALYAANRPGGVSLRMVSPGGTPLGRRYFAPRDNRELSADDLVRGYEIEKGRFVIVDDDELERLAPERTRDIDLRQFVKRSEIDPMYFERAYYLTPTGGSNKAYRLLARVMEETGRAGVATFVLRSREYLVAIMAENGILRAETLRFADELRTPEYVGLPASVEAPETELRRMTREIGKLAEETVARDEFTDHAAERMRKLVEKKRRAGEDVVQVEEEDREGPSDIIDLMEILRRRLQGEEEDAPASPAPARKPAARKTSSSKATPRKTSSRKATPKKSASKAASKKSAADLGEQSKTELLEQARKLDIPGRSGMSKDELVRAIRRSA